jgi:hypothetical protein
MRVAVRPGDDTTAIRPQQREPVLVTLGDVALENPPDRSAWLAAMLVLTRRVGARWGHPLCELCGQERAKDFLLVRRRWARRESWWVAGRCIRRERYAIRLRDFFASPARSEHWLRHISGKVWFDPDDVAAVLTRLAQAPQVSPTTAAKKKKPV